MEERKMFAVLTIVQALQFAAAIFFHEPSSIVVKAYVDEIYTDFGFAMAYRSNPKSLVVGAPKVNQIGKVYNCEMDDADILINCDEKIISISSSDYNAENFPNQYFYMGASIAVTSDYLFTCAPLMTQTLKTVSDSFGTCFVDNETDSQRYQGTFERYLEHPSNFPDLRKFSGGTGWSVLLDKENDLLLIVKTSLSGDILYVPMSNPLIETKSLTSNRKNERFLLKYLNIGYGITAGKFFSKTRTMYAFSMTLMGMEGAISFLKYNQKINLLSPMFSKHGSEIVLKNKAIDAMFGMTMSAADLNTDGLDELLVGAPALSEEECVECGALHIYIGGDKDTINEKKRLRTILGTTYLGRFGTAIAAKDIDGDSIPELVVSAPYENDGHGAVYILSGYEVCHTLVKFWDYKSILLSDLKLTQRIQKKPFKTLGFSLQFVDDIDNNGCSELAAGSPGGGNGTVQLFKCLQAINVTMSSQLIGEQTVREQDDNFTVNVCAQVQLPSLPKHIVGNITVVNSIIGQAAVIPKPNLVIDISCFDCPRNRTVCKEVLVKLKDKGPGDYTFTSKAELQNRYIPHSKEFNSSWVVASRHSKLDKSLEVSRHCKGNDCKPNLSYNLTWSGGRKKYFLGSSTNETLTIKVRNDGNASYDACVMLRVSGAPLSRVDCKALNDEYRCYLPKPLRREAEYSINLIFNMTKLTNLEKRLLVDVRLYENCNQKLVFKGKAEIPYGVTSDGMFLIGKSHSLNITDKQISDNTTVYDDHEYVIKNNHITWKRIHVLITMQKEPYIASFKMSSMDFGECELEDLGDPMFRYDCTLDLMPNTTYKIIGTTGIVGGHLKGYQLEADLNATSKIILDLDSRISPLKHTQIVAQIRIVEEITLSRNKLYISLIAVFMAIIILAILIFVLYKCGYFRRKQQQKLLVMKESIRRKSIRRDTHASAIDGPLEGLQMDVDEDPFDEVQPVTNKDNVGLVDVKC